MSSISKSGRKPFAAIPLAALLLGPFGPLPASANFSTPEPGPTAAVHPEVLNLQASFSKVADLVMPSVVSISTVHVEQHPEKQQFYFGDPQQFFNPDGQDDQGPSNRPYKMEGVGSGVIIDPAGLVLTNEHVVRGAEQIKVQLYDKDGNKTEYTGHVVGKDAHTDVAVVRIHVGHKLPFVALGNSENVKVGDWAIAIGSPFGLAQTFTVGVISAARQSLIIEDKQYHNLIQTDAAINRGNSGGPLLNIHGEVVGINTAIYAPTGVFAGIGFAVPINQAKAILDQLINKGHVVRGWLGIELAEEITPAIAKNFGLPDTHGALVNSVMKKSPAEKAGLLRGDVVRRYGDTDILTADQLQTLVSQTAPNKSVTIQAIRAHKPIALTLVTGERPESADTSDADGGASEGADKPKTHHKEWLGAHVAEFTPELAQNFQQPDDAQGVIVTEIDGASRAEDIGLAPGDLIRSVNQVPTTDLSTFASATSHAKLSEGVVLDVLRQGQPIYLSYTEGQ